MPDDTTSVLLGSSTKEQTVKRWKCKSCCILFDNKLVLFKHIQHDHNLNGDDFDIDSNYIVVELESVYACTKCGHNFLSEDLHVFYVVHKHNDREESAEVGQWCKTCINWTFIRSYLHTPW